MTSSVVKRIGLEHRLHSERVRYLVTYLAVVLGVLALVVGRETQANTDPSIVSFGLGVSLLASAFFLFLTATRSNIAQKFLDQGIQQSFLNRYHAFSNDDWTALIRGATGRYRVLGVANHGYMRSANADECRAAFTEVLKRKVQVEILWLHPGDERMRTRERDERGRKTTLDTIEAINAFREFRASLDQEEQGRLILKVYKKTPTCGIAWIDNYLVVTHYLSTEPNKFAPGLVLTRDSGIFRSILTWQNPFAPGAQLAERYIQYFEEISAEAEELPSVDELERIKGEAIGASSDRVSEEDLA